MSSTPGGRSAVLDLGDRQVVRVGLRAVLIKHETDLAAFDRAFDLVFADGAELPGDERAGAPQRAPAVAPIAAPQLAVGRGHGGRGR